MKKRLNGHSPSDPIVSLSQIQELNEIFTRVMGQIFLTPTSSESESNLFNTLTWMQKKTLFLIEAQGPQKMSAIAQALSLTLSGATAFIDKLVRMGLVTRIADASDRRVIRIDLSEDGRQLCGECKVVQERCFREIMERLDEGERTELLGSFQRIYRLLTTIEHAAKANETTDIAVFQNESHT